MVGAVCSNFATFVKSLLYQEVNPGLSPGLIQDPGNPPGRGQTSSLQRLALADKKMHDTTQPRYLRAPAGAPLDGPHAAAAHHRERRMVLGRCFQDGLAHACETRMFTKAIPEMCSSYALR